MRYAVVLALSLAWQTVSAVAPSAPDFTSQVSREEAVVVSITTVFLESPFILDPDDAAVREGSVGLLRTVPLASAYAHRPRRSLASGFIVSADGQILTSAHAVTANSQMTIRLADGREFIGRVVGLDEFSDVALLKIDADKLPAALIGDPGRLAVGDWVVAIGAPFGLESSVTAGIVSAKRLLPDTGGIAFIQTDVAVNPGSSGGPLFNLAGEVIGMNSMVYTSSGGYMGVSFALPIDVAIGISRQLRARGYVVRGELGLGVQELTPGLARAFGRSHATGALVSRVRPGSPAERAGCRVGDIVLGFDDRRDMSYGDIQRGVAERSPGTAVTLAVWRGGAVHSLRMNVAASPPTPPLPQEPAPHGARQADRLGLVVVASPSDRAPEAGPGLEIREAYGAALRAGIGAGDRILGINDMVIGRIAEYAAVLSRLPRGTFVALLVTREGRHAYFALELTGEGH